MTHLVCATHGHCFDGMASAALLTELATHEKKLSRVDYIACGYGPHAGSPRFDGDENALLDFRYHASQELSYYYDHHKTAFVSDADRAHFQGRSQVDPTRFVWDPKSVSCAGLVARVAKSEFDFEMPQHHEPLLHWADKIDGARFESAAEATDRSEPVMRLASVVERFGDSRFLSEAVPLLKNEGLGALAGARFVKDHYRSISKHFKAYEERVLKRGTPKGRCVFVDLTDETVHVISKFFHYKAYPEALYSVILTNVGSGLKLSIGYNPWHGAPLDIDIGSICARHGGGGHPVVGAIGFPMKEGEKALRLALDIVDELQTPAKGFPTAS